MYFLLGIDDTDAQDSSSTVDLALTLGSKLESRTQAKLLNISCHQLIQHPSITQNGRNIACCLFLDVEKEKHREIDLACREILLKESAPGSNAGYALAAWAQFDHELIVWGKTAKMNLLKRQDALNLARRCGLSTAGILGSGCGVIGALAAVGLRFEGNDGWIEWMPGLKGLFGTYTQIQLTQYVQFDSIENQQGSHPAMDDLILFEHSVKPLLKDSKIILSVARAKKGTEYEWIA